MIRTSEIIEPHWPNVRHGNTIQVIEWPVRVWFNVFDVTEKFDDKTETWIISKKKFVRFFDRKVFEHEQNAPENLGLVFSVVDKEWLEKEREILS